MVDGDLLAWEEVALFESSLSIANHFTLDSWRWASALLSVLTGSTQRVLLELGGGRLNSTSALSVGQDARSH